MAFVEVPEIAGQVNVAVPEVLPDPVNTQDRLAVVPQFNAVNVPAAAVPVPIAAGLANVLPPN